MTKHSRLRQIAPLGLIFLGLFIASTVFMARLFAVSVPGEGQLNAVLRLRIVTIHLADHGLVEISRYHPVTTQKPAAALPDVQQAGSVASQSLSDQ